MAPHPSCAHCSNGGTCLFHGPESEDYRCVCPPGFRGRHCESAYNECATQLSTPCPPGARCIGAPGTYSCQCPPGQVMLQYQCVRKLNCADQPCQNEGLCLTVIGEHRDYQCECRLGFQGVDCEKAGATCTTNYCGPHGACIATPSGPKCHCLAPYFGAKCELLSKHPRLPPFAAIHNDSSLSETIRSYETLQLFSISAAIFLGILSFGSVALCAYVAVRRYQIYDLQGRADAWNVIKDTCCCRSFEETQIVVYHEILPSRKEYKMQGRLKRTQQRIDRALRSEEQDLRALAAHLHRSKQLRKGTRKSLEEMHRLITSI